MAFVRPTLGELVSRVQADFVSRLDLPGVLLRRTMVAVLARVVAGAVHMLHGHLEFLGAQLFPDTSEDEFLVRQAALFGLVRTAPTFGTCSVGFYGPTAGVTIPAGTRLRSAAGYEFETTADGTLTSYFPFVQPPSAAVSVTAVLAGAAPNVTGGTVLSLESPIAGVQSSAVVLNSPTPIDGVDEETTDALRARLLERIAEPPRGGTSGDYIAWAKQLAGVTRVWVTPLEFGPGTVGVRFVRDNDASLIPDAGEVSALQTWIDGLKPAHATVTVIAPVAAPLAMTISVTPDTVAIRAAVTAELTDLLDRTAAPGATTLLSSLLTAIGATPGVTDYTVTVPAADVTHTANQLATLSTITWT